MNAAAFVLAVGVPIFNQLIGIAASLFASWYTYGIAGFFWLYDAYHRYQPRSASSPPGSYAAWREHWFMTVLCLLTILAGAFICVAGMYVNVDSIIVAYSSGGLPKPLSC